MKMCDTAICNQTLRHSHHPLPDVQIMRALIHQNTAALSSPGCSPGAGIIISLRAVPVRDCPAKTDQFAKLSLLKASSQLCKKRIRPLVVHNPVNASALLCRPVDLFRCCSINSFRLLCQHMEPLLQSLLRNHGMHRVRSCNQNSINLSG